MNEFESGIYKYTDAKVPSEALSTRENVKMQLKRRLIEHQNHINKISDLLTLLEKNPDFEKMLNLTREIL